MCYSLSAKSNKRMEQFKEFKNDINLVRRVVVRICVTLHKEKISRGKARFLSLYSDPFGANVGHERRGNKEKTKFITRRRVIKRP